MPVLVISCDVLKSSQRFSDTVQDYEIRFVQLNGVAIRDMAAVDGGFLIIGGPMGDAPGPYNLYFWDGTDMVYGKDRPAPMPPAVLHLDPITPPLGENGARGKAEGITVLDETAAGYHVLIIYDSIENGGPQQWFVPKP